jgi:drug/metabolite transporter (DMT)-like permease
MDPFAKGRIPVRVIWGLAVAIALDTAVQLFWKWVASWLPDGPWQDVALTILHRPYPLLLAALMVAQAVNWLKLLEHADLSFVQPITALSYISVCLLSALLFSEELGHIQLAGIACILLGVWFISRSGHQGEAAGGKIPHELEP